MSSFTDLLKSTASILSRKAKEALDWYKQKILKIGTTSSTFDPDNIMKQTSVPEIGKMYLYTYNPLTREKLPFFDMYPLTIVTDYYSGPNGPGFIGLNLHYLPPVARAALLSQLLTLRNNQQMDNTTKLNISYGILKKYNSQFSGYRNCVKRYLMAHVVSSYHEINSNDWEKVVLLPLQRWIINPRNHRRSPPY